MFYSFSVQCCVGHCLSLPLFLLIIGCCISPSICGFWYHFNIFKTYQKCQTLRWFRVYGVSSLSTVFRLYLTNVSPFHIYIPFLFILCANELHLNNINIYNFIQYPQIFLSEFKMFTHTRRTNLNIQYQVTQHALFSCTLPSP